MPRFPSVPSAHRYRDDHHGAKVSVRAHHGPPDKADVGHAYTVHRSHLDEETLDVEDEEHEDDWYDDDDDDDWDDDDDEDEWDDDDDNIAHDGTSHRQPLDHEDHPIVKQNALGGLLHAYRGGTTMSAVAWVALGCATVGLALGAKRARRWLTRISRRRSRRSSADDQNHCRIPICVDEGDEDAVMIITRRASSDSRIKGAGNSAATAGAPSLRNCHSLPVSLP
jgi:hypothetical protein